MQDEHSQDNLESLSRRKPNTPISIAADLASDSLDSICRLSLAWISEGQVHGISFLIKPPTAEFTNRKITPQMVADSPSFADVWDQEIAKLLHGAIIAAYKTQRLFLAIKASYESSGRPISMDDAYVRDVHFLATAYIADLGNDSFASIMHYMKIAVDLDNSLSRAMACSCCIRWLDLFYPVGSYGIPLSAIMAGALQTLPERKETESEPKAPAARFECLAARSQRLFLPFFLSCLFIMSYFLYRADMSSSGNVDFARYALPAAVSSEKSGAAGTLSVGSLVTLPPETPVLTDSRLLPKWRAAIGQGGSMESFFSQNSLSFTRCKEATEAIVIARENADGFIAVQIVGGPASGSTGYVRRDALGNTP